MLERDIFIAALERDDPSERAALLDDAVTSQTVSAEELGIDPVPDRVPQVADMVGV